MDTNSNWG